MKSRSDNSLAAALSYTGNKTRVKFDVGCLKQDRVYIYSFKNSKYILLMK